MIPIEDMGLGRLYVPDERDKAFPMSAALPAEMPDITEMYWWADGWWGDQGSTSQCVAYSWMHWIADGPVTHDSPAPMFEPVDVYKEAQKIDQWPGENYNGTSVRAGAKILQQRGIITSYTWAWEIGQIIRALLTAGPVVVGTTWKRDMFFPDSKFRVRATGPGSGGHAYLLNGVDTVNEMIRLKNSWGKKWGDNGHAWMSFSDMASLIEDQGEACLAIETETRL